MMNSDDDYWMDKTKQNKTRYHRGKGKKQTNNEMNQQRQKKQ